LYENVKDNFLRWFQLRILHNILATNNFLYKIKILNSEKCTFCNDFPETIDHLFWKWEIVQILHNKIKDILEKTDAQYRPEEMSFILGNLENRKHYLFILEIKRFIYWCRRKKQHLSINLFKKLLELKLKVHKNLPKTESDKGIDQFQIFEPFSNSAL